MPLLPRSLLLCSILALAACAREPAPDAQAQSSPPASTAPAAVASPAPAAPSGIASDGADARWDGLGPVKLGMDEAAVRGTWKGILQGDAPMSGSTCMQLFPGGAEPPASPSFMFEEGRLVRYDVTDNAHTAPGGGSVGMQQAQIENLHPGIEVTPHKYTNGRYLRAVNGENVLVFETSDAGMVTRWRIGRAPQVDYVEGCS